MRLIDADRMKSEVKEIYPDDVELTEWIDGQPTVCDIDAIRAEIEESIDSYVCDKETNTPKAQGMINAKIMALNIIDKYTKGENE